MGLARQFVHYGARWYAGLDWMPYQAAAGLSLRRLEGWHFRVYVGPVKVYGGRSDVAAR